MKYDFIEIGTSDFATLSEVLGPLEKTGICVEPLSYYLNRVPSFENIIKENSAISDRDGEIEIFYCKEEVIAQYRLPYWIRGCNSVGDYHPTVLKEIAKRSLDKSVISVESVNVMSYETLIRHYNVRSVDVLKIDTEGHDCVILNAMLDFYDKYGDEYVPPLQIRFEANILTNKDVLNATLSRLFAADYRVQQRTHEDIVVCKGQ